MWTICNPTLLLLQAESTTFHPHPALLEKIHEYVDAGRDVAGDIRVLLESYVKTELLKGKDVPSPMDGRFFPTEDTIRNVIYK